MGLSLSGGVFNEDFNYGYPYDKVLADSAAEFEYSGSARTHSGIYKSSFYGRKQFTLHYRNHRYEPKNYDVGIHGGSHDNNFHYLLFPILQWNQVQVLTLKLRLSAPGTLSYDKGFDGFHKDEFYVIVNNTVRHFHTTTAGHGWITQSTSIGAGLNVIQFVLKTAKYVPPRTRGGTGVASSHPPNHPRYLRMTSINITNVSSIVDAPHSHANMIGSTTLGAAGSIEAYSGPVEAQAYSSLFEGFTSGEIFMTASSSFITDWLTERDMGQAVLQGDSSLTINATIDQNHEAYDGGVEIGTGGQLTIKVPIDTPQSITDRTKVLSTVYYDYSVTPVVVGGKLIVPTYQDVQTSTATTAGSYVYTDPVSVTSIQHVLPVTPLYRWLATDVGGADDSPVSTWPEHTGSTPAWASAAPYQPTVHPHEHFSTEGLNLVTYSRVIHMWWESVQHMWINLGTNPTGAHYTFQIVGIIHPMNHLQFQYVLDNGWAPPADYSDQLNLDTPVNFTEGNGTTGTCAMGFYDKGVRILDTSQGKSAFKAAPVITTRPQVITVVYGDNSASGVSGVTVYQHGYRLNNRVNAVVPINTSHNFLLGRWKNTVSREHASHMSIMEIAFFNRALSSAEAKTNADYLAGVYQFNRYV